MPALLVDRRRAAEIGKASGRFIDHICGVIAAILTCVNSPDPVLTGVLLAQTVKGIQSEGVVACAKHYIGNEQEHFRQAPEALGVTGFNVSDSASSNIDDVTLHETYLW